MLGIEMGVQIGKRAHNLPVVIVDDDASQGTRYEHSLLILLSAGGAVHSR
jgi:hypothetical protein